MATTRTVTGTVLKPDGSVYTEWAVRFYLKAEIVSDGSVIPRQTVEITTSSNGTFTTALTVPDTGTAAYMVEFATGNIFDINLAAGDPTNLQTLITVATTSVDPDDLQTLLDANSISVENSDTISLDLTDNVLTAELTAFPTDLIPVASTFRAYRAAAFTFSAINTWTDIPMDTKVEIGATENFSFYNEGIAGEDKSIIVASQEGTYLMGGYISPDWTGGINDTPLVAIRVLKSVDDGENWLEEPNIQALTQKARGTGEFDTMSYFGSIRTLAGMWIKLQVYISDVALILSGSSVFTNPIAATVTLYGVH